MIFRQKYLVALLCAVAFSASALANNHDHAHTHSHDIKLADNFPTKITKAQPSAVSKAVQKDNAKFVEIFKDIHQNPELGFMETRTAGIVAKELKSYGFEVKTGIAKTGVVGILKNGDGPVVMYRADMDANAVKEETNLPYKSTKIVTKPDGTTTPVMHACGHDAHTTWLMSSAKFMAENKHLWKGTLVMVAQPAEELIEGAEAMVKDGLYTKHGVPEPDHLFGIHTAPIPVGMVAAATGVRMAGTDQLDVTFYGVGGHGSTPQYTKDPVLMATMAVNSYQSIISRAVSPQNAAVLTVGSIQAGLDNNVIPSSALLKINLRWFSEDDRKLMIDGIQRINNSIASAYNVDKDKYPTMVHKGWSYPLDNAEELTKVVRDGLKERMKIDLLATEELVPATMGSEDFHHLVIHNDKKNYSYINVGIAEPKRFEKSFKERKAPPFNNHNGDFEVDINAIPFGTEVAVNGLLSIFDHYKKS